MVLKKTNKEKIAAGICTCSSLEVMFTPAANVVQGIVLAATSVMPLGKAFARALRQAHVHTKLQKITRRQIHTTSR